MINYQAPGKNSLTVNFSDNSKVTFEIHSQFRIAAIDKKEAKRLIKDLQCWVEGGLPE